MTPEPSSPDHLLHHLGADGVIAMPTDTLPALATRPEAAGQLWQLKGRTLDKPLILMGAEADQLWQALDIKPQAAWQKAVDHWPGALTLVVPHSGPLARWLNPAQPTSLGLRVPDHGATRALLRRSGPLATTSANRSAQPALLDPDAIALAFPQVLLAGPFPWSAPSGRASTVVAWRSGQWVTIRAGAIQAADWPS
ncbi:MAG: L-threonylcarbamoyladenylate synthase [Synechococcus sp. SB0669_bin_7]|nr:L-threonylcarbamoyladenylate synthase [Synechococcus sp. SB0675_bin_7]MYK86388.1 L-threonylcarbamoyladenylate synthase [Synechococcus sp. SB0669_bin_7]